MEPGPPPEPHSPKQPRGTTRWGRARHEEAGLRSWDILVEESSGNVFADRGLPDAEERPARADPAIAIGREIDSRGLTRAEAAKLL